MSEYTLFSLTYNHQAAWIDPIKKFIPQAREIGAQKQDILVTFQAPDQSTFQIAIELKASDVESTIMGFGKGGKLAHEFQESYCKASLGFKEVWLLIALTDKPYKQERYNKALEACLSTAFRQAFVKVYESRESTITNLRKMIAEYSPDAKTTAKVNDSNLPSTLHRILAQIEGVGDLGQQGATAFNQYSQSVGITLGLNEALVWILDWMHEHYPEDNRTRLLYDYLGSLIEPGSNVIGEPKTKKLPQPFAVEYPFFCTMDNQPKTIQECGKCPSFDEEGHCDAQCVDMKNGFSKEMKQ